MKKHLLTLLLISIGMAIPTANATVTGTWSDATTTFGYNYNWHNDDYLDGWNDFDGCATYNYTFEEGGTTWTTTATPAIATGTYHSWYYKNWLWFNRPCDSGSDHWKQDWNDNYNASATSTVFPIINTIAEFSSGGPSDLGLNYVGYHGASYTEVHNGQTNSASFSTSTNGFAVSSTLLGSRGSDQCSTNTSWTVVSDPEANPVHTGGGADSLVRNLSCSASYQVSYTGPTNTYAVVDWNLNPWAYYKCNSATGGDDISEVHINPGASAGPGAQISFPLESIQAVFIGVGP